MRYRRISYRYTVRQVGIPQFGDIRSEALPFSLAEPTWRPPADVYEGDQGWVVKVEIPGVAEEELAIDLYADAVVIAGSRSAPLPCEDARVVAMEIRYGPFRLEVPLPRGVDREAIRADYQAGFLFLHLPREGVGA